MTLKKNIGNTDRTIRLIAGLLLIFWGINAGNGLTFIGFYLLATVYFRTDPVYGFIGMNSRSGSEDTSDIEPQKVRVEPQGSLEDREWNNDGRS